MTPWEAILGVHDGDWVDDLELAEGASLACYDQSLN